MSSGPRTQVADILERIVAARRRAVKQAKQTTPAPKLEERAAVAPPVRDFAAALSRKGLNVIAELKRASPSRAPLRKDYNPAQLAPALEAVGACALSVLTEPEFFHGSLEDLQVARSLTQVPALRKDFIFDSYQVYEARAAGADSFLLISAILQTAELKALITLGKQLGMVALVEAHTAEELERALEGGAEIVGINNRELRTFEVSLETSLRLIESVPEGCLAVSESGLRTRDDLRRLRAAGFDAFLIGEHLMQAVEPASALRQLLAEV
ncbi:MAG: indole-3-glycerol phosphate synthase TrpC [Acidobacteria bacterium]|nr:indole-3-glycerol phosphate synthase TrpC [Acidobacteriota bacterium]